MNLIVNERLIESFSGITLMPENGETVRELLERVTIFNPPSKYPVIDLVVAMPCCGKKYEYRTLDDIPTKTTPCSCGKPEYYVIKVDDGTHETRT